MSYKMNKNLAIQLGDVNFDNKSETSQDIAKSSKDTEQSSQQGQEKKKKYSTPREATLNLFKGYIGSGILALPYAFDEVGYLLSTFVFMLVAVIIYYTMGLLFQIADDVGKPGQGYPQLAEQLLGAKGVLAVKSMLVLFQMGCCVSYVIFFLKFFEHAFNTTDNKADDIIYLLLALCIILPMSLVNDIKTFSKASMVGNAFVVSTLIVIFINDFHMMATNPEAANNAKDLADFSRIPMIIGVSIYGFEAIGLVFSIRNSLERVQDFGRIFRNINIAICILYISFAICGVIALGHTMNEIILFSMPNKFFIHMFQIMYAIALVLSYPLQLLPSFQIIEDHRKLKLYINKDQPRWRIRQFWLRFAITMIICWSAFLIPRFAVFLNMIGSIAGTSLQFFFPIMMYQQVYGQTMNKRTKIINMFVLVFGIVGGLCGFGFSIYELISPNEAD